MTKRWTAPARALALVFALAFALTGCTKGVDSSSSSSGPEFAPPPSSVSQPASSSRPESASDVSNKVPDISRVTGTAAPEGVDPLTGGEAPEGLEAGSRPVAVMVRNSPRAVPQAGLSGAQAVVEMPIEDGTTNLMALYTDLHNVPNTGPVCAIQDQFAQLALPLDAIPVYIGASQYARNLFALLDYKTVDGMYLGGTSFWYDEARSLPRLTGHLHEYNWFTNADGIWAGMTVVDIMPTGTVPSLFKFADERAPVGGDATEITATFSSRAYTILRYNAEKDRYTDSLAGTGGEEVERIEAEDKRITYKNVLLLETAIGQKEDSNLLEFDLSGGTGWYFTGGGVQEVKWQKGGPQEPLRIYDTGNRELEVKQGRSYIGFVPKGEETGVQYK